MLRSLLRDFRHYPATMALCSLWVLIYLFMVLTALRNGGVPAWDSLLLGAVNSHRFGDLTINELYHGEVWRTLTATFVHFGILHLGMNLFGMYQLGCLVESWYGPGQFLLLYVLIGSGGNAISGVIRHERGQSPYIHSGGGSTELLGLVALCAVVGWRSRTRIGDYLKSQMIKVLILTALLWLLPFIDNWGHLGGALCGAALGFAHRFLVRNAQRPSARWAGVFGALVLVACGAAQFLDNRVEAAVARARVAAEAKARDRLIQSERTIGVLAQVGLAYRLATQPLRADHGGFMPKQARGALKLAGNLLDSVRDDLDQGPTQRDFRRARALLVQARSEPPSPLESQEFNQCLGRIISQAILTHRAVEREYPALVTQRRLRRAGPPS